jgi:hypothetical protein
VTPTQAPIAGPWHRSLTATPASPLSAAAVGGVAFGALTALAQGWLPDSVASLANSAGPWTLIAVAAAFLATTARVAAGTGALALAALLAGYILGATARGAHASASLLVFWGLAAVIVGPVVGLSAHWLRYPHRGPAPLAVGALTGVLIGEGVYGLTVISSTTNPWYWSIELAIGIGLLVWLAAGRLHHARPIGLALLATALVTEGIVVTYQRGLGLLG